MLPDTLSTVDESHSMDKSPRHVSPNPRHSLKVVLYTDSDIFAGTERHILELARGLRQENVDVAIACPEASPLIDLASRMGVKTIHVEKRGLLDSSAIRRLRRLFRSGEIDIVHAHNGRTALLSVIAAMLAGKGSVVATQHFLEPAHTTLHGLSAILSRKVHRWVQQEARHFIAVSGAAKELMLGRNSGLSHKLSWIPNGISAPELDSLVPVDSVRQALRVTSDMLLIVCAARLEHEKHVDDLVVAMKGVTEKFPRAMCVVAGTGSLRDSLQKRINEQGLSGGVRLLGFREDALSLIQAADIFVLPSRAEPFGLVLLEAMALGKPVVACAAGGPLEIVEHGVTGLLVAPGEPSAMSEALLQLLTDPIARKKMGESGRRRYEDYFTTEKMSAATLNVYVESLKTSSFRIRG